MEQERTAERRRLGETDDTRIGMGLEGLIKLREFIAQGGVFIGSNSSAEFAISNNFTHGVNAGAAGSTTRVVGSLLRTKIVDEASPLVYGVPDNLAMDSGNGVYFTVRPRPRAAAGAEARLRLRLRRGKRGRAGRPAAAGGRRAGARRTTRTRSRAGRCTKART